jgi:hypothetical protein
VIDVVLARQPALPVMGRGGTLVGLPDQLAVLRLEMVGDPEEFRNGHLNQEFRSPLS